MKQLTDWLVYLMVRIVICAIQSVRIETCQWACRWLAYLVSDVLRLRGKVVDENLRGVYPELGNAQVRRIARDMWCHLLLMICEIALAPRKIHQTNWRNHFALHQPRLLVDYLLSRRPMVLVSGHFGNFEITSFIAGFMGFPTHAIARSLDNRYLDRYVRRFREANGQFIIPKDGSAGQIDAVLRRGGVIALLGDQSAGRKGCWVDFLGRPASSHKAVALFTLVSGAPLAICFGRRLDTPLKFELGVTAVADPAIGGDHLGGVRELTQWYNDRLGEIIHQTPEQYWWVHRRWKGQPPKRGHRSPRKIKRAPQKSAA